MKIPTFSYLTSASCHFLSSVHSRAVPAAPGTAGPHAETAAGAEPTAAAAAAAASQQPRNNHQHTGQSGWTHGPEP